MNLFIRNSPYYHLLKYLLVLLKHPVYGTSLTRRNMIRHSWLFEGNSVWHYYYGRGIITG